MLFARMLRAMRFDGRLYEELRKDPVAVAQAVAVVMLGIIAMGLGGALDALADGTSVAGAMFAGWVYMPGFWLVPAVSLFLLGDLAQNLEPGRGTTRDLLITIGFSASPAAVWLFRFVPGGDTILFPIVLAWLMTSMLMATRAMLRVSILRAIIFLAPGVLVFVFVWVVLGILVG